MFSFLGILIIIVISHLSNARNDSLSRNYQFSNQNLIVTDNSFDNKTLFYALYTKSSQQCNVVQEINPFTNSSTVKKCKFVLKVDSLKLIASFGTEKAILIAQESTSKSLKLKAITVRVDECKIKEENLAEVPLNWSNRKFHRDNIDVVVTNESFEVIIKGLSHLCTKPDVKVYCGVSFDADGNKIEGPLIWPKMAYEKIDVVSPIMADASGQGYFIVNRDLSLYAFQVNRKGGPKYVKLWYTPIEHSSIWREGYSTANKVDGMCYSVNTTIGCWQTDREGELKIQVEFEFDRKFKASIRQCNTTQSSKIQEATTQVITTSQGTTTLQSTTVEEPTTTQETIALETTIEETTTKDILMLTEMTIEESVTHDSTEDTMMEPITVQGITIQDITTQEATTLNDTVEEEVMRDNTTESNTVIDSATIQSNETQENNATAVDDTTNVNVILDYNTADVITVQGLTTQGYTVTEIETSAVQETTVEDEIIEENTVQGIITVQENTTEKNVVRRSLPQTDEQEVWNLFVHNLRNGGFVVLLVTCPNRHCNGNDDHYYLMKINTQGRLIGQLEVNVNSKCNPADNDVFAKVFENDQGQYCSTRLCKSMIKNEERLEILVNCYCNSDFK